MTAVPHSWVCGVDAAGLGASSVAIAANQCRWLGAEAGLPTLAYPSQCGMPFRIDFGDPTPIERDLTPDRIQRWWEDIEAVEPPEPDALEISTLAYMIDQVCPKVPSRVGIVVHDSIRSEAAESMLRALGRMRTPRGHLSLIPWPIAAAWSWLDRYGATLPAFTRSSKTIIGSVLVVHLAERGWQATPIHVVFDPEDGTLVPARDRDGDRLTAGAWALATAPSATDMQSEAIADLGGECLGVCFAGRPLRERAEYLSLISKLSDIAPSGSGRVACEGATRTGLLSRGAALAAIEIANWRVPYYESVPKFELLGFVRGRSLQPPHGRAAIKCWVDVLEKLGDVEQLQGRRLLPAATRIKYTPPLDQINVEGGEGEFYLAFDGRDVRRVFADVASNAAQEPVSLQVEWELGAGRPTVTVIRVRAPDDPIVLRWDAADPVQGTRDAITTRNRAKALDERARAEDLYREMVRRRTGLR